MIRPIQLKGILTRNEISHVKRLLNNQDFRGLRVFLSARRRKLLRKGVLPEYLSYHIEEIIPKNKLREVM